MSDPNCGRCRQPIAEVLSMYSCAVCMVMLHKYCLIRHVCSAKHRGQRRGLKVVK